MHLGFCEHVDLFFGIVVALLNLRKIEAAQNVSFAADDVKSKFSFANDSAKGKLCHCWLNCEVNWTRGAWTKTQKLTLCCCFKPYTAYFALVLEIFFKTAILWHYTFLRFYVGALSSVG